MKQRLSTVCSCRNIWIAALRLRRRDLWGVLGVSRLGFGLRKGRSVELRLDGGVRLAALPDVPPITRRRSRISQTVR